jgi:superfamily I DNA/RNA helicase
LVVIGDELQAVNKFKGADARFLTLAKRLYADAPVSQNFQTLNLRTSFRINKSMAEFVTRAMLRRHPDSELAVRSTRKSPVPIFYVLNWPKESAYWVADSLIRAVKERGNYAPGDIFVLAPSVATVNPESVLRTLENTLVEAGIPCYVQPGDNTEVSEDDMNGKVAFLTFAACKGLERRVAVVLHFEVGFFDYFAKEPWVDRNTCPPVLYVAATRAREILYLVAEARQGDHLPFLDRHVVREMSQRNPKAVMVCCLF